MSEPKSFLGDWEAIIKSTQLAPRLRKHCVRRRDGTSRPPAQIVLEAADALEAVQSELSRLREALAKAEEEAEHWKANHADVASKKRSGRQRLIAHYEALLAEAGEVLAKAHVALDLAQCVIDADADPTSFNAIQDRHKLVVSFLARLKQREGSTSHADMGGGDA